MFSHWEIIAVIVVVLIVFGAGKLPEVGQKLGASIRNFQRSIKGDDEDDDPKELPPGETPKQIPDK